MVAEAAWKANHVQLPLLAVSGWLASGKDTVADTVFARDDIVPDGLVAAKSSLATPMKREMTDIFDTIAQAADGDDAAKAVASRHGCTYADAVPLIGVLTEGRQFGEAASELTGLTGWDRTSAVRRALQYWGTDVRRKTNTNYWIDKAVASVIDNLAEGRLLYFCDCRFPNEVTGLQDVGYRVLRLSITRATQTARLFDRDGLTPDPAAVNHASETALDGFNGFDAVVDNNGPIEDTVEHTLKALCLRLTTPIPG